MDPMGLSHPSTGRVREGGLQKKQPLRELDRGGATKSTYLLSMD